MASSGSTTALLTWLFTQSWDRRNCSSNGCDSAFIASPIFVAEFLKNIIYALFLDAAHLIQVAPHGYLRQLIHADMLCGGNPFRSAEQDCGNVGVQVYSGSMKCFPYSKSQVREPGRFPPILSRLWPNQLSCASTT